MVTEKTTANIIAVVYLLVVLAVLMESIILDELLEENGYGVKHC
jgi:hypothetical protein